MKVFIRQNATTKTGYELVTINDVGDEVRQPIIDETKDGISYILPENVSNRKFFAKSKLGDEPVELTYKESKTFGPRTNNGEPRKKVEDYLTDDEKVIIADLMAKAKARREADKPKPLTEREKLERQIEKLQAKLKNYKED